MTPEQMQIVRLSLAQAMADRLVVEREFYRRLFTIAPDLGGRFRGKVENETFKLQNTLALAFGALTDMQFLVGTLEGLARRGVGRDLSDKHCRAIAQSLLWSIERRLGAAFTQQVCDAWIALFAVVVAVLRTAPPQAKRSRAA